MTRARVRRSNPNHRPVFRAAQANSSDANSDRERALADLLSFYLAFGDADVYVISELPSNEAAAAVALSVNRSGAVKVRTAVLLTPEQVDAAAKMAPEYRPPGA